VWRLVIPVILLAAALFVLRARARLRGMRAGDLFKVEVPRQLARPLAMGTRIDIGAVLKKAGTPAAEIRPLLDGQHDRELLDRYWALRDGGGGGPGT
jgi:hypothetical protein